MKPSAETTAQKIYLTRLFVTLIGLLCMSQSFAWVKKYLSDYEGPWWMRLGVVLIPWLIFGIYLLVARKLWRPDELQVLIGHRTIVFVFYGMLLGAICLSQLQMARLIPEFAWTEKRVGLTLFWLFAIGALWNKFRYR